VPEFDSGFFCPNCNRMKVLFDLKRLDIFFSTDLVNKKSSSFSYDPNLTEFVKKEDNNFLGAPDFYIFSELLYSSSASSVVGARVVIDLIY
jgi:hypothetical protein